MTSPTPALITMPGATALRPRTSPRTKQRAYGLWIAVIAAAVAIAMSSSAVAISGAYFTAGKVTVGNSMNAATVDIGGLGADATPNTVLAVSNLLPLSDADSTVDTKGSFLAVNVRNVGTVPIDWSVNFISLTSVPTEFAGLIRVRVSTDNGATFGGTQSLSAVSATTGINLAAPTQAVPSVVRVKLRLWLDKSAGNAVQNATASFSTETKAIQSGVSMTTTGVTYPQ